MGGYLVVYMGSTAFGIELHVPESQLEKAQELINSVPIAEDE
ncbi:hypothetical protein C7959_1082 [Orenia marismortui]|uniref:Signal transducing protein n=1 Tax=Orenia marismortui TaxID=46469 RepID=A0A4V3GYF0_9FIRM|nr:hypothetical protein C7959_1082 [Orenia marismortui]